MKKSLEFYEIVYCFLLKYSFENVLRIGGVITLARLLHTKETKEGIPSKHRHASMDKKTRILRMLTPAPPPGSIALDFVPLRSLLTPRGRKSSWLVHADQVLIISGVIFARAPSLLDCSIDSHRAASSVPSLQSNVFCMLLLFFFRRRIRLASHFHVKSFATRRTVGIPRPFSAVSGLDFVNAEVLQLKSHWLQD